MVISCFYACMVYARLWLRKVESYLKDAGLAGLAYALAMARRRPKEYRRKVDAATRCSGVCPHT